MILSRRDLGKVALASIPAARAFAKPNSNIGGVQIGVITYSFRQMPDANDAKTLLRYIVDCGVSGVELMNGPAEAFASAPAGPRGGGSGGGPLGPRGGGPEGKQGARGKGGGRGAMTPEQQEAQRRAAEEMRNWRLSVSMDKFKALRKMYEEAGVSIYAFKLGLTEGMSDDEYDYAFNVAKVLGANQLTMELPTSLELSKRIGEFAAKHKIYAAYHNHTQVNEQSFAETLAQSPYNGLNLDVGHFTAAINKSPIPFIRQHHARIHSMHFKDRKYSSNGGANLPWGEGETPLKEVLQLMKKEKYKFPATIELEYQVPEGSDILAEVAKCVRYCRQALA